MKREYIAAAAQLGPIAKDEPRSSAVARMVALLHEAQALGADVVVFPELALTTFFHAGISRAMPSSRLGMKPKCPIGMCGLCLTQLRN